MVAAAAQDCPSCVIHHHHHLNHMCLSDAEENPLRNSLGWGGLSQLLCKYN